MYLPVVNYHVLYLLNYDNCCVYKKCMGDKQKQSLHFEYNVLYFLRDGHEQSR